MADSNILGKLFDVISPAGICIAFAVLFAFAVTWLSDNGEC